MKIIISFKSIWVLILFTSLNIYAQVDPGVDFDLQGYINQKLDAGETNIVVPAGRYRVSPNGNHHLRFANLSDITIVADGVEMICTETVQAIQIVNCTNFKLQGLSVDFDPLPFTQGRIVSLSGDKRTLNVDIIDGYSTTVTGDKLEIYDPTIGELSTTTYYNVSYSVNKSARTMVITKPANYSVTTSLEKVGDIIVMGSQNTRFSPHAILPNECLNLVLENVTIYAGTTFGFFEQNCSNSSYINCKVDRRPLTTEIVERGIRRMRSNNADAFHSKHANVGPSYINCEARYNGDDGIAINGDYHVVTSANGTRLSVVPKAAGNLNLVVGDSVELVSYTGKRFPNAKITKIETGPALTSTEKQFLQNQTFYGGAAKTHTANNVYYITIDRAASLPMGSLIASANRIGNGFEVRDCVMGPNRSRGILVKASNGIITGNRLVENWGQAIKLAPEYVWLEAGSGSNVTISNNVIIDCHDAAIAVYSNGGNGETSPVGAHNAIQIIGNSITGSSNPAIAVTSTSKLKLTDNTIESINNDLLVPWIMNNFGRNEDPNREIYLKNVELVEDETTNADEYSRRLFGIKILKNPFSEFLRLEFPNSKEISYSIYDVMGRKIYSSTAGMAGDINTSDWQKGLYILSVEGRGSVKLLKI